jgi:hypothetical protein
VDSFVAIEIAFASEYLQTSITSQLWSIRGAPPHRVKGIHLSRTIPRHSKSKNEAREKWLSCNDRRNQSLRRYTVMSGHCTEALLIYLNSWSDRQRTGDKTVKGIIVVVERWVKAHNTALLEIASNKGSGRSGQSFRQDVLPRSP